MKSKKILFFIAGDYPTEQEFAAARALDTKMFRNSKQVTPTDSVEQCEAVAGLVPPSYAAKYPRADAPAASPAPASVPQAVTGQESQPQPAAEPSPAPVEPVASEPAAPAAPALPSLAELSDSATVAQIKAALANAGIEFPPKANKGELLALYNSHRNS